MPLYAPAPSALPSAIGATNAIQPSYSTTNVQVAGVDEADTVKTDGKYLYVINQDYSGASQNNIYILNADPQNPAVISKIALGNNTDLAGMYLSQDGDRLAVLGSN